MTFRSEGWEKRVMRTASAFCACLAVVCGTAAAQTQQRQPNAPASELSRDNMSRVAASATELKAVLLKDTGLLVELKRWVAKDATDHGQIVTDADMTNDAIFDRLETDVQFRSIATLLVQRYGYLTPQLNPDSQLGKEQELLTQERTKWLAQSQEEQMAAARQRSQRGDVETTGGCDPQFDTNCETQMQSNGRNGTNGNSQQNTRQPNGGNAPNGTSPYQQNPSEPPDSQRDQQQMSVPPNRLIQTSAENSNNYAAQQLNERMEIGRASCRERV